MVDKRPVSIDFSDEEQNSLTDRQPEFTFTETLDLNGLLMPEVGVSVIDDVGGGIWAGTFGKLLKVLPLPAVMIDQFRDIVLANPAWGRITCDYHRILGRPFSRLFPKLSHALQFESLVSDVFSTRKTVVWEALLKIEGKKLWGRLTFRSIRIGVKKFLLILVEDLSAEKKKHLLDRKYKEVLENRVAERTEELREKNEALLREIAERRRSEEARRESEQRFRAVFDCHHAVMLIVDPYSGRVEDASPGACAFYGYSREELTKMKITQIDNASHEETWKSLRMAKSRQRRYFDFRHRLANGDVREVEVCSGPVVVGGRTLLFSVIHDVTERKRAEQAANESRQRVELAMHGAKLGLWDWNLKTGRPNWDNRMIEILGYSQDEIQLDVRTWKGLIHRDDWPAVSDRLNAYMHGRLPSFDVECRCRCKSGGWKWILSQGKIVEYDADGAPIRMTGTSLDVTERKAAQQESEALRAQLVQAQKMESIGTLAGGIAHDFNNLLTVILGFSELLLADKSQADPDYADLYSINQAARNGADLVKGILSFSRKAEMNPRRLNLNRVVEQARKLLARTIPKMVEIELLLSERPTTVYGDPTQLEQILMNLAVNAKDAMPDGGKLTLETRNVVLDEEYCRLNLGARKGDYVMLSVTDTGHGMDNEVLQHIFEPFFTTKESGLGTGLGLAAVYGIVKQHGGYITCHSKPGQGTTFRIYLPWIPEEPNRDDPTDALPAPRGTERVLLVDDEKMIREYGKRILEQSGYAVLTSADGGRALDLYRKEGHKISLVILDLIMPGMSGRKCLERLLRINQRVKVLIASGDAAGGGVREAVKAGAKGFVGKPYNTSQMLGAVRQALDAD